MAKLQFNAAKEEGMTDFQVIPAGEYNAQVVKSEIKKTSAGTGMLLKLQFKIIDGKYKGRIVFSQYNIENPNPEAVKISRGQMKTLCDAIGKQDGVEDSNEMHNIPLSIRLKIVPPSGKYAEKNEISFYKKYEGPAIGEGTGSSNSKNVSNPSAEGDGTVQSDAKKDTEEAPWNKK